MRPVYVIILSVFSLLSGYGAAQAQCGSCTPDVTCYQPGGAQCPASGQAPPMYLNNPYSTVVTFDMPPDTNVSPIGVVNIVNVQYASITGLPIGISWSCNSQANGCQYNPSAGETKACITFCGTPLSPPGNYTVTINIYGTASTPIGNQTQYQPLQYTFTILPDSASNGYFSMAPASGCDSIAVDYEAIYSLPLPNLVSYNWDFDNGNTFSGPIPPPQSYADPGTYYPTLTTHISNLVVKKVTTSVSGNWWCGDVEEPNWPVIGCTGQPDVFFRLIHGASVYTSSATSDNSVGEWDNLNIMLESALFTISLWDDDPTSQADDGGSTVLNITGPGIYNYTTNAPSGGGGFGLIEVIEVYTSDIVTVDTVQVDSLPPVVDITALPSDTVCEKGQITLSVYAGPYHYIWYKDGAILTDSAGNSIVVQDESGEYKVHVTDTITGCATWMNPIQIYFKPSVYNTFVTYGNGVLMANPSTGFSYQWYLNGNPVNPGGNAGLYTPTVTGTYSCIVSNNFGCSDTTNNFVVTSLMGIGENANLADQLEVFPNPATDRISISFGSHSDCMADIRIMNNMGSVVKSQRVSCTGGGNTFEISVADLAAGMYYLEFKTESGFAAKRFIKK